MLTQPKGFYKTRTKLIPLFKLLMRRYPAITRAMAQRHTMYNNQLAFVQQQEALGNTFVIAPQQPLPIARTDMDPQKIRDVYEIGRNTCSALLPQLKRFIEK